MTIKIVTKLTMLITMPDASVRYLRSSSSLPERHLHYRCKSRASQKPSVAKSLAASRVKLPSITPGCLPKYVKFIHSFSQPASTFC